MTRLKTKGKNKANVKTSWNKDWRQAKQKQDIRQKQNKQKTKAKQKKTRQKYN